MLRGCSPRRWMISPGNDAVSVDRLIFPATEWTIHNAMGSEPKLPTWVEMSNEIIPVELGKLLAGQYRDPGQCMATIKERVDRSAAAFRKG